MNDTKFSWRVIQESVSLNHSYSNNKYNNKQTQSKA